MTIYGKLTLLALQSGEKDAAEAWETGKIPLSDDYSASTLEKGCPRAAFLGLAGARHIKGLNSSSPQNENARHVLSAYALLAEHPEFRENKLQWWQAVKKQRGITRKGQNGVLDVLLTLIEEERFQP